ncbi:MAG: anhydro-N-acetylmuramic acid kinase, partial [Clostridia bacterium]
MQQIQELANRSPLLAIGLMSGTSGDGVDAALVEIEGAGLDTHVRLRAFFTQPFSDAVRRHILTLAGGDVGGTEAICRLHFLLGQLYAEACLTVCAQAGVSPDAIDFVGS